MPAAARRLTSVAARPKIIAPYERVSAIMGREDEAFRSPDIQHKANVAAIKAAGHIVYEDPSGRRFCDVDRTGLDFHREEITRLRALKRQGVIDGIATLDVSRVGRTPPETLQVIDEFRADGGVYLSTHERIDDSPQGEFMLGIFVGMAALYSNNDRSGLACGDRGACRERRAQRPRADRLQAREARHRAHARRDRPGDCPDDRRGVRALRRW